jgi:DNA-binding beta-propeller fold protein YncE
MIKRRVLLALLGILIGWGGASMAQATPPAKTVTFQVTDTPGSWFDCSASTAGCVVIGGEKSLAVIAPGDTVEFVSTGQAATLHTAVSLMFPTGAAQMPYDIGAPLVPPGTTQPTNTPTVTLQDPGLYVFICDIHPYMFAAVIVDDSKTPELDLGKTVDLPKVTAGGIATLPTASDLVLRLVHAFFVITNPDNWQDYSKAKWYPTYPAVPVLAYDVHGNPVSISSTPTIPGLTDLNVALQATFGETGGRTLTAYGHPVTPGVGQVWVNTQFELSGKTKPGTATAVNATSWKVERKVGLPSIKGGQGMNNPHNMWTDKDQTVIYQTEWFDNYLVVFDRKTGIQEANSPILVGPAPAHVMTRTNNDQVHVSLNGGNAVQELESLTAVHPNKFIQNIDMGNPGENVHPHAHWMSAGGSMMVTPNEDSGDSTLYSFPNQKIETRTLTGHLPIATTIMPDSSKYYVGNFLDSTMSVLSITGLPHNPQAHLKTTINLMGKYDPITGPPTKTPWGILPIQTPVSPDGRFMVTANILSETLTIVDTRTDTVVASLPCDAGCHGVQWGAKDGGGYYAYVSNQFSNRMLVVDPKNGHDAFIAGSVLLSTQNKSFDFHSDVTVTPKSDGMGGQGVLPIPVVYNGWVQNLPPFWKHQLTHQQQHPIGEDEHGSH